MNTTYRTTGLRAWLPVIGLAFAAFIFNTSEFLPVGLLPDIAQSTGETVSFMGLILTGYAWIVAVMSLPLTAWTAKIERKKLLLCLIAIFALAHFAVILTDTFMTLFATRIAVALCHCIFWAIMTPLAARFAPLGKRAVGLAAVMSGSITATVLGIPIGTRLGQFVGWQIAFFTVGIAASMLFIVICCVLPRADAQHAGSLASLPMLLKRKGLLQVYALTVVTMLGQFTVYSYINPILASTAGLDEHAIVVMLFIFGISGILGTFISTKTVDRHLSATMTIPLVVMSIALLCLNFFATQRFWMLVSLVLCWGAAMTAICMALQSALLSVAYDATDVATALFSGIFNVGIGGGAFIGSQLSARLGFTPLPYVGAGLVACSALLCIVVWITTGSAIFGFARPGESRKN